jgi:hypothetical protein
MSIEELQNQKFRDVMSIRLYYDWHRYSAAVPEVPPLAHGCRFSDALMEECVRMMQQQLRAAPTLRKKAKSVYSQRSLGTIKDRKREKKEEKDVSSGEVIMRILRMRYNLLLGDEGRQLTLYIDLEPKTSSHNSFRLCSRCRRSKRDVPNRRRSVGAGAQVCAGLGARSLPSPPSQKSHQFQNDRSCLLNALTDIPCWFVLLLVCCIV